MLEVWRLGVLASSHLALGSANEARGVLEHARTHLGGLRPAEAASFSPDLRAFAAQCFDDWPADSEAESGGLQLFEPHGGVLTERELEVLRDLSGDASREEIAKKRFISVNTLKAHLRSIYRKLDVGSRSAAVLEAEQRGLL